VERRKYDDYLASTNGIFFVQRTSLYERVNAALKLMTYFQVCANTVRQENVDYYEEHKTRKETEQGKKERYDIANILPEIFGRTYTHNPLLSNMLSGRRSR